MPQKLGSEATAQLAHALMNEKQRAEFAREMECNFAIIVARVSFMQQGQVGMVLRTIAAEIPNFEKLRLPEVLKQLHAS